MLTIPLVRALLQKVTVVWVVDGHVALFVEVTGPGIAKSTRNGSSNVSCAADGSGERRGA